MLQAIICLAVVRMKCPKCGRKIRLGPVDLRKPGRGEMEFVWDPTAIQPDGTIKIPDGKWV